MKIIICWLILLGQFLFINPIKSQSIVGAMRHTLFICVDSTVMGCGYNPSGAVGDSTTTSIITPVVVNGLSEIIKVAGGVAHSLFLKNDLTVWSCGDNFYGQLGNGTNIIDTIIPVQVSGLTGIIDISGGYNYSLFLKNNGTVWACGDNNYGQLGGSSHTDRFSPVGVLGLTGIIHLASGINHSLFIKNNGTVWACGQNNSGQLGDSTIASDKNVSVQVKGLSGIIAVAGGGFHSLFLRNDGTVWACGQNNVGQLGDSTTINKLIPVQITSLTGITAISAGWYHSLFLKNDGTVWVCGENNSGQLGIGDSSVNNVIKPVQISGLSNIVAISSGTYHNFFLKNDGTVWACGNNGNGELGDGTYGNKYAPVQINGLCSIPSSYLLSGTVYKNSILTPLTAGKIYLKKYKSSSVALQNIDSTDISPNGTYQFPINQLDSFVILAVPDNTVNPNVMPTYYDSTSQWVSAKIIVPAGNLIGLNIFIDEMDTSTTGPGNISGVLIEGDGFHKVLGKTPIKKVDASLMKTGTTKAVRHCITDTLGQFIFSKVPIGSYYLWVDITGIPVDTSVLNLQFTVTTSDTVFSNLIVAVDSNLIYIDTSLTGIKKIISQSKSAMLKIFPNPTGENLIIESFITQPCMAQISLVNILGQKEIYFEEEINVGIYRKEININKLNPGIYFLQGFLNENFMMKVVKQ